MYLRKIYHCTLYDKHEKPIDTCTVATGDEAQAKEEAAEYWFTRVTSGRIKVVEIKLGLAA